MHFITIYPSDWGNMHSDWHGWCAELVWDIPALESRRQWAEITELNAQHNAAIKARDNQLAASLLLRVNELCAEHSRFIDEHRASQPKLPLFRRPETKRKLKRHA